MKKLLSTLSLAIVLLSTTAFAGVTGESSRHANDNLVETVLDWSGIGHG